MTEILMLKQVLLLTLKTFPQSAISMHGSCLDFNKINYSLLYLRNSLVSYKIVITGENEY